LIFNDRTAVSVPEIRANIPKTITRASAPATRLKRITIPKISEMNPPVIASDSFLITFLSLIAEAIWNIPETKAHADTNIIITAIDSAGRMNIKIPVIIFIIPSNIFKALCPLSKDEILSVNRDIPAVMRNTAKNIISEISTIPGEKNAMRPKRIKRIPLRVNSHHLF